MRVLVCHNYYQQPGGEDESFACEADLLERHGHEVVRYTVHNRAIDQMSGLGVAARTVWNRQTYAALTELMRRERPDIMHCTNTFPLISPAAYYAARRQGVRVVQSLRNYRLICPAATMLRDGRPCERCLGKKFPWPAIWHACYRNHRAGSAVVSCMLAAHHGMRTWTRMVDAYFALTHFSRRKFIEGGLPAEKIHVKPNFLYPDPGPGEGRGRYAVFVGRLAAEKGIETLLSAWANMKAPPPLKIVGDGPLRDRVQRDAGVDARISWLGRRSPQDVLSVIGDAAFLVVPSLWYEGFPRAILEAMARGTPIITSRLGSMQELVHDGGTGLHFRPGDAEDLAAKITRLAGDNRLRWQLGREARREYEAKYTAAANYRTLLEIYDGSTSSAGMVPARRNAPSGEMASDRNTESPSALPRRPSCRVSTEK